MIVVVWSRDMIGHVVSYVTWFVWSLRGMLLLSKQLHRRFRWVALAVKSQEGMVLPSTYLTTPRLCGGWSQSGGVRLAGLKGSGPVDKPLAQLFMVEDCSWSRVISKLMMVPSVWSQFQHYSVLGLLLATIWPAPCRSIYTPQSAHDDQLAISTISP